MTRYFFKPLEPLTNCVGYPNHHKKKKWKADKFLD